MNNEHEAHARDIRVAAADLNQRIERASEAGIYVELRVTTAHERVTQYGRIPVQKVTPNLSVPL